MRTKVNFSSFVGLLGALLVVLAGCQKGKVSVSDASSDQPAEETPDPETETDAATGDGGDKEHTADPKNQKTATESGTSTTTATDTSENTGTGSDTDTDTSHNTGSGSDTSTSLDQTVPEVLAVVPVSADGPYGVSRSITLRVQFTHAVAATGAPTLLLETGATDRTASFVSVTTTALADDTIEFSYSPVAGDISSDLDYHSANALSAGSGSILSATNAAVAADLELPASGGPGSLADQAAYVIDTVAPIVSNVTAATGNPLIVYEGQTVPITVTFTKSVNVTGTPKLVLETGASDAQATYSSGTGTATLTFSYVVAAGENSERLRYASTTPILLAGGSIKDAAGNDASPTFPAVTGAGSLYANRLIRVDTTPPLPLAVFQASPSPHGKAVEIVYRAAPTTYSYEPHALPVIRRVYGTTPPPDCATGDDVVASAFLSGSLASGLSVIHDAIPDPETHASYRVCLTDSGNLKTESQTATSAKSAPLIHRAAVTGTEYSGIFDPISWLYGYNKADETCEGNFGPGWRAVLNSNGSVSYRVFAGGEVYQADGSTYIGTATEFLNTGSGATGLPISPVNHPIWIGGAPGSCDNWGFSSESPSENAAVMDVNNTSANWSATTTALCGSAPNRLLCLDNQVGDPADLSVSVTATNSAILEWDPPLTGTARGYRVAWSPTPMPECPAGGPTTAIVESGATTTFEVTGLTAGLFYFFRVCSLADLIHGSASPGLLTFARIETSYSRTKVIEATPGNCFASLTPDSCADGTPTDTDVSATWIAGSNVLRFSMAERTDPWNTAVGINLAEGANPLQGCASPAFVTSFDLTSPILENDHPVASNSFYRFAPCTLSPFGTFYDGAVRTIATGQSIVLKVSNWSGAGDFGGQGSADAICQGEATLNGFGGTWQAMLGNSPLSGPVLSSPAGTSSATLIATSLQSDPLVEPITSWGGASVAGSAVWTGLSWCSGWTSTLDLDGVQGNPTAGSWAEVMDNGDGPYSCATVARLYCYRVDP